MQYRQPSLRLQVAAKRRDRPEDQSTGYMTGAATGLERNNTVMRPLGHMITESDVPDYAELQRHYGH